MHGILTLRPPLYGGFFMEGFDMESKVLVRYCVKCGHLLTLRIRYPIFFDTMDAVLFEDDMYIQSAHFAAGQPVQFLILINL